MAVANRDLIEVRGERCDRRAGFECEGEMGWGGGWNGMNKGFTFMSSCYILFSLGGA